MGEENVKLTVFRITVAFLAFLVVMGLMYMGFMSSLQDKNKFILERAQFELVKLRNMSAEEYYNKTKQDLVNRIEKAEKALGK